MIFLFCGTVVLKDRQSRNFFALNYLIKIFLNYVEDKMKACNGSWQNGSVIKIGGCNVRKNVLLCE